MASKQEFIPLMAPPSPQKYGKQRSLRQAYRGILQMKFKLQYQDIIINNKLIRKGDRDCDRRYSAMKPFLERYKQDGHFNVLDFGANCGYYTWMIKQDYPNAQITMVEGKEIIKDIYELNNQVKGVKLINEFIHLNELKEMAKTKHYDLILLLSVLHHFNEDVLDDLIDTFIQMGTTVLFEIDEPDHPNYRRLEKPVYEAVMKKKPIQINTWIDLERPMYYYSKDEIVFNTHVESGMNLANQHTWMINNQFGWFGHTNLYPGTLNLRSQRPINFCKNQAVKVAMGYFILPAYLNGYPIFSMMKDFSPNSTFIEILSPKKLRQKFYLMDSDPVTLSFKKDFIREGRNGYLNCNII
ncbi:MAG: methyltransferase [Methanobacteriaceae archaeon]|nr:methyltransferase [Methanobacteriaceae archaeon]